MKTKQYALKVSLELHERLLKRGPTAVRKALAEFAGAPELCVINKIGRPSSKRIHGDDFPCGALSRISAGMPE